jgi:phage/plasmid-like protein (TIGR03299 family)
MAHELEIKKDGTAKFAYSIEGGRPWHQLGKPMSGLQTVDSMLEAAEADYTVSLTRVAAIDDDGNVILNPDGTPVIIHDSRATVRVNADGTFDGLSTVGTRYEVRQNREVAERALAVVGASMGEAIIDTCGVLRDGRRFFMTIDLGSLVIDPAGVNDKIDRYLVVSCGHDGVWPIRYANTDIRAVCNNTVMMGLRQAKRVFTARHTSNVDSTIADAQEVLRISTKWASEFQAEAEKLLSIPVIPGSPAIKTVLDKVFPLDKGASDRQKRNHDAIIGQVRSIFNNERNAGGFGYNGWSLYNAIVEYLDHGREADVLDRANASMDENSWVTRLKFVSHEAVRSLA